MLIRLCAWVSLIVSSEVAALGRGQPWARYLEGNKIPTKIGSGRDRDWAGYLNFFTNRDRVRQPDSLNFRGNSGKIEANPDSPQFLA